jgi:hypothetical protein
MARFYGTIRGRKGEVHRLGYATTGLTVEVKGWHTGVESYIHVGEDGEDEITLIMTSGSSTRNTGVCIGTIHLSKETGLPVFVPHEPGRTVMMGSEHSFGE